MTTTDTRISTFHVEADKILEHLHMEFSKLQTGRANAALVEHVQVTSYGQKQDLRSLAGISVQDARSIVIQPWDKGVLRDIEVAIEDQLDLGTSPVNDGNVIRLNLPPMTEERRTQLNKVVNQLAEEARISVRQKRQDAHDDIKDNEKDEDVRYTLLEQLEKEVKAMNENIEESKKKKEEEIMTV
jgi:ribosome recycling factor